MIYATYTSLSIILLNIQISFFFFFFFRFDLFFFLISFQFFVLYLMACITTHKKKKIPQNCRLGGGKKELVWKNSVLGGFLLLYPSIKLLAECICVFHPGSIFLFLLFCLFNEQFIACVTTFKKATFYRIKIFFSCKLKILFCGGEQFWLGQVFILKLTKQIKNYQKNRFCDIMYGFFDPLENFPDLSHHDNFLAKCLTKELYASLFEQTSATGFSLDKAIQVGIDCPNEPIGMYFGDEDSFRVFWPLLEKIIEKSQPYFAHSNESTKKKFQVSKHVSNVSSLVTNPYESGPIKSNELVTLLATKVKRYTFHIRRNLKGYNLPTHCTRAERREVNIRLTDVLSNLPLQKEKQTSGNEINDEIKEEKTTGSTNLKKQKSSETKTGNNTNKPSGSKLKAKGDNGKEPVQKNVPKDKHQSKNNDVNNSEAAKTNTKAKPLSQETKIKANNSNARNSKIMEKKENVALTTQNLANKSSKVTNEKKSKLTPSTATSASVFNANDVENNYQDVNAIENNHIIELTNVDEGCLGELEQLKLAPHRDLSLSDIYLVSGLSRDFPDARSIFYNKDAQVGAWTNHENHLEMVVHCDGMDFRRAFEKFIFVHERSL
ncbi:hypothetical protein RFI_11238 [Reticulomyxa filosa]|uniref:Phosphagen kinase N-terminal domain-containing protein n=1 Tax=Reticulomyxa filosa TaxID=46433 RepID=X6NHX6_RETFI|nr:hypothetical protein RFI_11238 [Reticulomyxa filosa]|eukprot:ETO25900.1 hypothetical protein RFI_11238 [Reticulomyxa filosa]